MSAPPAGVERDYPLARLTTVRTGGAADWFARPGDDEAAGRAAALGRRRGAGGRSDRLRLEPAGRRRRFRGLAIKLDGELAAIEREGERVALRRRRPPALGRGEGRRLGPRRARVRRQHPRHRRRGGADERQRLRRPAGRGARVGRGLHRRRAPSAARRTQLGFAYRSSNLRAGEVVSRAAFRLRPGDPAAIRATPGGDARAPPRGPALGDQDLRLDLQEPRGRARRGPHRPASCSRRPAAAACATAAPASPRSTPTSSRTPATRRTADVLELMAEGRRRVHERFGVELEPEVQVLGEVELARAAGSCEARLIADRGRDPRRDRGRVRLPVRSSATRRVEPRVQVPRAGGDDRRAATKRSAVAADGAVVRLAAAAGRTARCRGCRSTSRRKAAALQGPALEQVRVLAAAPAALRPYVEGSYYGESGVDVEPHLGDRTALRRRHPGRAQVEGGGGGARRPLDRQRSIM